MDILLPIYGTLVLLLTNAPISAPSTLNSLAGAPAPLRQRKEDIPLLAEHFLRVISARMNRPTPSLTRTNIAELQAYDWPGNVRELQNVIERAVITSRAGRVQFDVPPSWPSLIPVAASAQIARSWAGETEVLKKTRFVSGSAITSLLHCENAVERCMDLMALQSF